MTPDRALLVDLYELTMAQCYFESRKGYQATFDLFVREMPAGRNFLLAAGLADALDYARSLAFSREDIVYLRSLRLFTGSFLEYLRGFKFTGDIWAMPEGSVFFPNEPVIRVTADIIQAQVLESFFLNAVSAQSMLASKAARVALAAEGKTVFDFSLRRTHGADAALKAARGSYIAGFAGTSNVLAGKMYGIPVAGTMAHSFVMAFPSEIEAFAAYSRVYPDKSVLLVDTYDTMEGVRNAARIGQRLKRDGHDLAGIRLDSGDIDALSRRARRILDNAGLGQVKIIASGNLDERAIVRLLEKGAPVDGFGVGTRMGASTDAPALDCIYKLSETAGPRGRFLPVMKLSRGKVTYPGRKQVYRRIGKDGRLERDVIGLDGERQPGLSLLEKFMEKGRLTKKIPSTSEARERAADSLNSLPEGLRDIEGKQVFAPMISAGLAGLTGNLRDRLSVRQRTSGGKEHNPRG